MRTSFEEHAAFTNVTFRFTDKFDIQVGGRGGRYKTHYSTDSSGPLLGGVTTIGQKLRAENEAFTYLLTPQFRVSPHLMTYLRLASGFRAGGANAIVVPLTPRGFAPDKTRNYEIGAKGTALSGNISGFLGASASYVGDRFGNFRTSAVAPRPGFPSYVKVDLRAGVRYESWEFNVFANNVTDRRAILEGDVAISPSFTFIQPRSAGLSITKTF